MVAIPPPRDEKWAGYRSLLPLMLGVVTLSAVNLAFTILYTIRIGSVGGVISSLLIGAVNLVIVGFWVYSYFKWILNALWVLIIFGISAVWRTGGFMGGVADQVGYKGKGGVLHGFLVILGAVIMVMLWWLTWIAWRVWRVNKNTSIV